MLGLALAVSIIAAKNTSWNDVGPKGGCTCPDPKLAIGSAVKVKDVNECGSKCEKDKDCVAGGFIFDKKATNCIMLKKCKYTKEAK